MKSQRRNKKVNDPAARTPPEISSDLQQLTPTTEVLADSEISFRECLIENFSFKEHSCKSVVFEERVLKHLDFSRSSLRGLRLKDVRLIECDFANVEVIGLKAVRAEFINCRLTGLRAVESQWQDLLISDGDASFSQFRLGTFMASEFNGCNFAEADFHGCDLRGIADDEEIAVSVLGAEIL